ncbi:MAG: redoxin domain-containing protein [Bacteroidetes bacterium]|nr:redoxin domain-containing protein [Bacteroidota bacterium]
MAKFWFLAAFLICATAGAHAQQVVPPFSFAGTGGKAVTFNDMPKGRTLFVLYFSPDCDHCNKQASLIRDQIQLFDKAAFLWVNAFNDMTEIKAFEQKYFPGRAGQFFFAKDEEFLFDRYFGESQVPSIYVYDTQGKRIASYHISPDGHFDEVPAATLAQHIH